VLVLHPEIHNDEVRFLGVEIEKVQGLGLKNVMIQMQGASAVVFCIGGPYGHGPQVHERANVKVKLSTMVLNHQVAFLVLLEQIYR